MEKFFILNCHGQTIGNKNGYRTIKGASRWAKSRKMQQIIWDTFYKNETSSNLVWEIVQNNDSKILESI